MQEFSKFSFLNPNKDVVEFSKTPISVNEKPVFSLSSLITSSVYKHLTTPIIESENKLNEQSVSIYKNPIPLYNGGNSCYINSSFQALLPSINKDMREAVRCARKYNTPAIKLVNTFLDKVESSMGAWNPVQAIDNLKYYSRNFRYGNQEDAQEFLSGLLDRLREEFDKIPPFKDEKNPIRRCYAPKYDCRYYCCACKKPNIKSPQLHEELTILLDMSDNIQSMINSYLRNSIDCYNCKNCKKTSGLARMNAVLFAAPKTFICCAKRFKNYLSGAKNCREIKFCESVYLPFVDSNGKTRQMYYDLSAIVIHLGSTINGGHYECLSRLNNQWYRISDSSVRKVDRMTIESSMRSSSYIYIFSLSSNQNPRSELSLVKAIDTQKHKTNHFMQHNRNNNNFNNKNNNNFELKRKFCSNSYSQYPTKFRKFENNKHNIRFGGNHSFSGSSGSSSGSYHYHNHNKSAPNFHRPHFSNKNFFQKSSNHSATSHNQRNMSGCSTTKTILCPNS